MIRMCSKPGQEDGPAEIMVEGLIAAPYPSLYLIPACRCTAGPDDGGWPSRYRQDRHGSTDHERTVPQLSRSAHAADYALQPGAERPVPEDYAAGYSVQIPAATGWVLQRAKGWGPVGEGDGDVRSSCSGIFRPDTYCDWVSAAEGRQTQGGTVGQALNVDAAGCSVQIPTATGWVLLTGMRMEGVMRSELNHRAEG